MGIYDCDINVTRSIDSRLTDLLFRSCLSNATSSGIRIKLHFPRGGRVRDGLDNPDVKWPDWTGQNG